jgi:hypothetical protein
MFLGSNEFKCLSNAVQQSCIRHGLSVTETCGPLVRQIIREHRVKIERVRSVLLRQIPTRQGYVDYFLEVVTIDDVVWTKNFQGSGLRLPVADFLLYDRERDGVAQYLHLVH